jgi:NADH-quinone oxidoreductase subunit H
VLACAPIGVYGIVLGGWSSGSPYPLLAALRSAAQVISYEIALGLSVVAVSSTRGSMSTSATSWRRRRGCGRVLLLRASCLRDRDGRRDQPGAVRPARGRVELVGGFHTEYTSLKFALFFLAEYVNMVTVSALATTLFLGGGTLARS